MPTISLPTNAGAVSPGYRRCGTALQLRDVSRAFAATRLSSSRRIIACATLLVALVGLPAPQPALAVRGGSIATATWPAIGSLRSVLLSGPHNCGGVLVSGRWFLTAGHCVGDARVEDPSTFVVTLGKSDLTQASAADRYRLDREIDRHPRYAQRSGLGATYDLALLHLSRPAVQDPMRIVSPTERALWRPGTSALLLGWGRTCRSCSSVLRLRQVRMPILGDAKCSSLERRLFRRSVMLCAGYRKKGGCEGDSGGPLMVGRLGEPVVIGITSGGRYECTAPRHPGLFARLGSPGLNRWIRERIPTVALSAVPAAPRSGDTVELAAAASKPSSQPGAPVYSWDLDNDGAFDDHTGRVVRVPSARAGTYPIRVQTVYSDGDRAVGREVVRVAATSR